MPFLFIIKIMEALLIEVRKLRRKLDINKILVKIFSDPKFQLQIINKVRYGQLYKEGVSEDNVVIGTYSPYTEKINPAKKAGTPYTLLDTGEFYASFRILLGDTYFIIDADGDKGEEDLFIKFNFAGNLIGLTDANMDWLIEMLKPKINEQIENILQ